MLFDTPQWAILPADMAKKWGNVNNQVLVQPVRGKPYTVLVTVPTQLHVLFLDTLNVPPDDEVWLSLEETETDGWYLYSEWSVGSLPATDLWRYPKLPPWAERQYALEE